MAIKSKVVSQGQMTAECWNVQIWGVEHCKTCRFENKKDCGGKNIIKTGKNEKGFKVPLN